MEDGIWRMQVLRCLLSSIFYLLSTNRAVPTSTYSAPPEVGSSTPPPRPLRRAVEVVVVGADFLQFCGAQKFERLRPLAVHAGHSRREHVGRCERPAMARDQREDRRDKND